MVCRTGGPGRESRRRRIELSVLALGLLLTLALGGCASARPPLSVADPVDLDRYLGK